MTAQSWMSGCKTALVLGRISNLPTVWSNLLAGWLLVGGENKWAILLPVFFGGSFLYIGGMSLNDFCDADFDARHCPERPIPAGKISRRAVGMVAVLWFAAGLGCLVPFGPNTAEIALFLLAAIVFYDFHHKNVAWAPLVMGVCRLLLYPLAASAFVGYRIRRGGLYHIHDQQFFQVIFQGITPGVVPAAISLGLYVAGITYLARGESRPGKPTRWALLLLLLPVAVLCGICACSNSPYRHMTLWPVLLIGLLQLCWMAWLLVPLWRKTNPSIGRVVSGLLAGIVLVDMLALVPLFGSLALILFPLFVLALLLQRIIPAT